MKTLTVAVAVAVVLAFIWMQESAATFHGAQQPEEAVSNEDPAADPQETPVDSWMMPSNRQKRGMKCKFCCNCCNLNGCGVCCDF
uniref:Hepcidin-2 n=1 Tax=Scophthalmus maximus TaxID=52904 RepID=H9C3M5_SCOMX|nr:hepcidin-2 [Scophthalmus maximus]